MIAAELLPTRDCATCTDAKKIQWGCAKDGTDPPMILDGEETRRCPRRPIYENPALYTEVFSLYRQSKLGFLPEPGGLQDQPYVLVQYFQQIDRALRTVEQEKKDREDRTARRKARAGHSKGNRRPRRR